jgi:hypothetical protein
MDDNDDIKVGDFQVPSTYDTIFKEIDCVLQAHLAPIPLSLQRAQMKQYQGNLIQIHQISLLY